MDNISKSIPLPLKFQSPQLFFAKYIKIKNDTTLDDSLVCKCKI